jgi:hypothetical protein
VEASFNGKYHGADYNGKKSAFNRPYTEGGLVINENIRELTFLKSNFKDIICIVQIHFYLNNPSNIFKIILKWNQKVYVVLMRSN